MKLALFALLSAGMFLAPFGVMAQDSASWRVGPAAWSFNRFSLYEAIDKTAALKLRYLEGFEGQKLRPDSELKLTAELESGEMKELRRKLDSAGVKLTSVYIHELPGDAEQCAKVFQFARALNVGTIVSEPAPESLDMIERFAVQTDIQVAIHNHPRGSSRYWHPREVLKVVEGRDRRIGACADLGHWQRSGIPPVEGIRLLGQRLLTLHVKDLNEMTPAGHDVPWGTGRGGLAAVFQEIERLELTPALFAIEYEYNWDDNSADIARCAAFFNETVAQLARAGGTGRAGQFLRAGAAQVDISPRKFPVIVNAMFTERSATAVVDPLFAKALVLDDGQKRIAFCVVDTCMMPRSLIDRAKELAQRATGIPVAHICVSATHTHSAPSAMGCLGSRVDPDYAAALPALIAEAIEQAAGRLVAVEVAWGTVDDWRHTFNRRWIRRPDRMLSDPFGETNVRANMHPGYESPDAIGPSGPVDPGLSVLAVREPGGKPLAIFANYSQHYYDSPLLSSDYYGRFALHLASLLRAAPDFVGIMSQGTSGDLMWMDYGSPAVTIGYDAYGREMADKVARLYQRLRWKRWVSLEAAERRLPLNYRVPSESRVRWARGVLKGLNGRLPQSLPEIYAGEAVALHERQRTELTLQAFRVGALGITAIPCEVYAITGLKLKLQSPLATTFNLSLANGAEGYIPPPEQHLLGGYTTWAARTAGLEVGAEPAIVETGLELLEEVSAQPRRRLFVAHGPYVDAVLASKPSAYWRLEEMVTPAVADTSGNGRDAVLEGGVAVFLPGVGSGDGRLPEPALRGSAFSGTHINRAVHFAGGRLRTPLLAEASCYSVELWCWNGLATDARSVTGHLVSLGNEDTASAGQHLAIAGAENAASAGRLLFYHGTEAGSGLVGRRPLNLRNWHHVVLVREGTRVSVYLDGELECTGEPPAQGGMRQLFVAGRWDNRDNFEGKVDEVALYDRGLSAAEVAAHFAASRSTRPGYAPEEE